MNPAELPWYVWVILVWIVISGGSRVMARWDRMVAHRRQLALEKIKAAAPPTPVCQCEHGLSMHAPVTGQCTAEVEKVVRWETQKVKAESSDFAMSIRIGTFEDSDTGDTYALEKIPVEWAISPCGCLRYVGPEPLVTLTAPELSDTAIEHGHRTTEPPADVARPYGLPRPAQTPHRAAPPVYESTFTYDPPQERT